MYLEDIDKSILTNKNDKEELFAVILSNFNIQNKYRELQFLKYINSDASSIICNMFGKVARIILYYGSLMLHVAKERPKNILSQNSATHF